MRIGFLASHRGSNMQAVVDACKAGRLSAEPCVVISNNGSSEAFLRAGREGIPAYHLSVKTHPDPGRLDEAICDVLTRHNPDLVLLAGYMKKLGPKTLRRFKDRIINIHPALLPKYGGRGMYGDAVHAAVLASGDAETGVTIHLVDQEYDHGEIIAQCRVPVEKGDTVETLARRVLRREHDFVVETLEKIRICGTRIPRDRAGACTFDGAP
jgi:phosphoribosylglycinamide formyltransferase-1